MEEMRFVRKSVVNNVRANERSQHFKPNVSDFARNFRWHHDFVYGIYKGETIRNLKHDRWCKSIITSIPV